MSRVGVVAIGRNEGERLKRCLQSLLHQCDRIVYVDSGSTDDSVAYARGLGIEVVELDPARPFSAARARNEGFAVLTARGDLDHVQFVDGDCTVEPGWIAAAQEVLEADPTLGIVTGWLVETDPGRNVFHAMCQVEWRGPEGDISACGGNFMVRADAFRRAGGFNLSLIAGEDDELCLRLAARTGLRVHRIPRAMARHDIDMSGLGQWWRRNVRTGHVFAQMSLFHPTHFRRERLRAWAYGCALPLMALLGAAIGRWWLVALAVAGLLLSWLRTARGLSRHKGLGAREALHQAAYLSLSKLPNLQGILTFHARRLRRDELRIIEHK
jgi:GT2 family glycosyltransferase